MAKNKRTAKNTVRTWNIFYTPLPCEHELLIKAPTLEAAVAKVQAVLNDGDYQVRGGWEVKELDKNDPWGDLQRRIAKA